MKHMRHTIIIPVAIALTLGVSRVRAQENPLTTPEVSFVNKASNKIVFRGDSSAWERYFTKLDRVVNEGVGQVNVVQIGGSHIQADMWSMEMRQRMQTMVPGIRAGRGFIFPYNMFKSNNPYWYNPEYTGRWTGVRNVLRTDSSALGIGGASVTTHDSITTLKVSFRGDVYPGYEFNRVKVLHRMDSSFAVDAWSTDGTMVITKSTNEQGGYTEFSYNHYTDTLYLRFQRTDSMQRQFTLRGIILESDDPGVIYHASGINGASTTSWLRCQRFTEELALLKPDLVILSIGINDAHDPDFTADRYQRNYEQLIARVLEASPSTAILLTTNNDSYMKRRTPNRNAEAVRDVMMRLSAKYGCGVWDTFGVMGGQYSIREWEQAGLAKKDRIHMTRAGYTLLGDLLFSAMMESYGDHLRHTFRP
ncbi:MAG: GDSL-type esterase/lipase family protein [Flavobacteriales bacterium]